MKNQLTRFLTCTFLAVGLAVTPALAKKPAPAESYGNNLSTPAIFAEGIGVTGLATNEATGLRGGLVPELIEPFDYNGSTYYLQQTQNTWQADWLDGDVAMESARVDWSDNMVRQTWTENSVIRAEVVLFKDMLEPLTGFEMTYLYGEGLDEVWATTGTTAATNLATIYSICARLKIEKLDAQGGAALGTLYDSAIYERFGVDGPTAAYSAETNVGGKIIYGYNWDLGKFDMASIGLPDEAKSGWYRLTFSLDPVANYTVTDEAGTETTYSIPCNTLLGTLDSMDLIGTSDPEVVVYEPQLVNPQQTTLEVFVGAIPTGKKK